MKGISSAEIIEYVSKHEDDKDNPTVWLIGPIDLTTRNKIDDMATSYEVDPGGPAEGPARAVFHFNQVKTDQVRVGLKGFKNFRDPNSGEEIPFKTVKTNRFGREMDIVSDETLNRIPRDVITDLAEQIDNSNKLSKEEIKN